MYTGCFGKTVNLNLKNWRDKKSPKTINQGCKTLPERGDLLQLRSKNRSSEYRVEFAGGCSAHSWL